jgi:hypothetical protein
MDEVSSALPTVAGELTPPPAGRKAGSLRAGAKSARRAGTGRERRHTEELALSNPVTHADVAAVYRGVLGRDPENAEVVDAFVAQGISLQDMIAQALRSDEFRNGQGARLGAYAGRPIPQLVQLPPPRPAGEPRVAALIRSHVMDEKFHQMWRALEGSGEPRLYDLFGLLDGDVLGPRKAEIDARYPNTVWTFAQDVRDAGLAQRSDEHPNMWLLGDFAMYLSVVQQPQYDYYVMIDYDLHFTKDPVAYMNRLCERLLSRSDDVLDGVGLDFSREPTPADQPRDWPFFAPAAKAFPKVWHFYFPIVAASRRGLLHAFAGRQLEAARQTPSQDLVFSESFLVCSLMSAGFNCQDFNTVLPGSYHIDSMGLQHVIAGQLSGLPLSRALIEPYPDVEMIHGVYSDEHFLARNLSIVHNSAQGLEMYRRDLASQYSGVIAPELLADYLDRAERRERELQASA